MHPLDQTSATRHEYPLATSRKVSQSVYAGLFFIGAGFFLKLAINPIGRDFAMAIGGISLILGLVIVLQAWTSRLILDGDQIEVRSVFRTHNAGRAEIEGLRSIENQYGRWTRVYLTQDLGSFSVSDSFEGNDNLKEWFKGLPDLDKRDADEITKEVSLQGPPAQEDASASNAFGRAKAWAIGLSVLTGAVSVPVMFVSYAPIYRASLIVLLACPIAGILLLHRFWLWFTVFKRKPDPRADLGFLILWPGIGVLFSYQTSNDPTHLVDSFHLIYWVLAVLVSFLAAVFPLVWRSPSRWAVLFFLFITGSAYSMGLVNSVNTLLDNSAAFPYETWVLKKSESHSSKGTRYFLHVAPWGPIGYSDEVDVPMHTYDGTRVGDPVCYGLHAGFLHGPWYTSVSCTEQPTPSNSPTKTDLEMLKRARSRYYSPGSRPAYIACDDTVDWDAVAKAEGVGIEHILESLKAMKISFVTRDESQTEIMVTGDAKSVSEQERIRQQVASFFHAYWTLADDRLIPRANTAYEVASTPDGYLVTQHLNNGSVTTVQMDRSFLIIKATVIGNPSGVELTPRFAMEDDGLLHLHSVLIGARRGESRLVYEYDFDYQQAGGFYVPQHVTMSQLGGLSFTHTFSNCRVLNKNNAPTRSTARSTEPR